MTPEKRRLIKDIEMLRAVISETVPVIDWAEREQGAAHVTDSKMMKYIDMVRDHIKEAMDCTVPDVIPERLDNRGEFV